MLITYFSRKCSNPYFQTDKSLFPREKHTRSKFVVLLTSIQLKMGKSSRLVYKDGRQFHSKSKLEDALRTAWNRLEKTS